MRGESRNLTHCSSRLDAIRELRDTPCVLSSTTELCSSPVRRGGSTVRLEGPTSVRLRAEVSGRLGPCPPAHSKVFIRTHPGPEDCWHPQQLAMFMDVAANSRQLPIVS